MASGKCFLVMLAHAASKRTLTSISAVVLLAVTVHLATRELLEPEYTSHLAVSYGEAGCQSIDTCAKEDGSTAQCSPGFVPINTDQCKTTCCPDAPPKDTCYYTESSSCASGYEAVPYEVSGLPTLCCTPGSSFWVNNPTWVASGNPSGCPSDYVYLKSWKLGDSLWWLCAPPAEVPASPGSVTARNFLDPCLAISSTEWCAKYTQASGGGVGGFGGGYRRVWQPGHRTSDGVVANSFSPAPNYEVQAVAAA